VTGDSSYPWNLVGYGEHAPRREWPGNAPIAVSIVRIGSREILRLLRDRRVPAA